MPAVPCYTLRSLLTVSKYMWMVVQRALGGVRCLSTTQLSKVANTAEEWVDISAAQDSLHI